MDDWKFKSARARVDKQGRLLIPADMRRQLGMEPGVAVTLMVDDGTLSVITLEAAIKRLQDTMRKYTKGRTGILDEFLRDRRIDSGE
jgi:AbrB family looped-hinge helix DNA binding protein